MVPRFLNNRPLFFGGLLLLALSAAAGSGSAAEMVGVVFTHQAVDLAAEIEGRLEAVHVQLGDGVDQGAALAQLNAWSLRHDLAMARATLASARAEELRASIQEEQARDFLARREGAPDSWSAEELNSARFAAELAAADLAIARANVSRNQAAVGQLEEKLAAAIIRAPFAGRIAERYAEPGERVVPGSLIVRLVGTDELWVRFAAAESLACSLEPGVPITVRLNAVAGLIPATVTATSPEIDPASKMFTAEAALALPDSLRDRVRPGMIAQVRPGKAE